MDHRDATPGQKRRVGLQEASAARGLGGQPEETGAVQNLRRGEAPALQGVLVVGVGLRKVKLEAQTVVHGVLIESVPQGRAGAVGAVESGVDADAPAVIAVVLLHGPYQGLAVGIRLKIEVVPQVHGEVRGQIGLDAALGAGPGHGLDGAVQAGEGGDAAAKALGDAQQGRGVGRLGVHPLLPGVNALRQPGPLVHLVGPAPENGLGQVGVAVDKPR